MAKVPPHLMKQNLAPEGVQVSAGAMAATARGMQAYAAAIGDVGDVVGKFAEENQDIENQRHLIEGKAAMQSAYSDYMDKVQNDKSIAPSSWVEGFDKHMGKHRPAIENKGYSPNVRRKLENEYTAFTSKARIHMASNALRESKNQTLMAFESSMADKKARGDYDGIEDDIKSIYDSGLSTLPQRDGMLAENKRQKEQGLMIANIEAYPLEEKNKLKKRQGVYGQMNDADYRKAKQRINVRLREVENGAITTFNEMRVDGLMETQSDFDAADKQGKWEGVSKLRKATMRAGITRTKPATREELAAAFGAADQLRRDVSSGKLTPEQHWDRYMDQTAFAYSLPKSRDKANLIKEVSDLSPYAETPERQKTGEKITRDYNLDRIDRFKESLSFPLGTYHVNPEKDEDPRFDSSDYLRKNNPKYVERRMADNRDADLKTEAMKRELRKFMDRKPKPSFEEIDKFTDGLISKESSRNGASILGIPRDADTLLPSPPVEGLTPPPER